MMRFQTGTMEFQLRTVEFKTGKFRQKTEMTGFEQANFLPNIRKLYVT
jgi:hypothetical protein